MECPECGQPVSREKLAADVMVFHCPACGWGQERLAELRADSEEPAAAPVSRAVSWRTWIKLLLFWALSLAIVAGPYCLFVFGLPYLAERRNWTLGDLAVERLADLLDPGYWVAAALYIGLAAVLTPRYDAENLGLFGGRWIDNPFSYEDDHNRAMRKLALFLLPGKCVWHTLSGSWRVLKRVVMGN